MAVLVSPGLVASAFATSRVLSSGCAALTDQTSTHRPSRAAVRRAVPKGCFALVAVACDREWHAGITTREREVRIRTTLARQQAAIVKQPTRRSVAGGIGVRAAGLPERFQVRAFQKFAQVAASDEQHHPIRIRFQQRRQLPARRKPKLRGLGEAKQRLTVPPAHAP